MTNHINKAFNTERCQWSTNCSKCWWDADHLWLWFSYRNLEKNLEHQF